MTRAARRRGSSGCRGSWGRRRRLRADRTCVEFVVLDPHHVDEHRPPFPDAGRTPWASKSVIGCILGPGGPRRRHLGLPGVERQMGTIRAARTSTRGHPSGIWFARGDPLQGPEQKGGRHEEGILRRVPRHRDPRLLRGGRGDVDVRLQVRRRERRGRGRRDRAGVRAHAHGRSPTPSGRSRGAT